MRNIFDLDSDFKVNGVYKITCIDNNKIYIGSCAARDFIQVRLIHHRNDLLSNRHQNKYLQRSFNKYGKEKFFVEVIEICHPEVCVSREQHWIDLLKPHYNLCKVAGSSKGREVSQETRDKISKSNLDWIMENSWFREKIREMHSGKKLGEEHLAILRKRSKESQRKIIDRNTGIIYESVKDCQEKLNLVPSVFYNILKGKSVKWKDKYKLEYYGD